MTGTAFQAVVPVGATTGPIAVTTPAGTVTSVTDFIVDLAVVPVPVDISPQTCPNLLNAKAGGFLRVAILGTGEFNATDVNPISLELIGVPPLRFSLQDVATPLPSNGNDECTDAGPDGFTDMTLRFEAQAVIQAIEASLGRPVSDGESIILPLTGELFDGTLIAGEDVVSIKRKGK